MRKHLQLQFLRAINIVPHPGKKILTKRKIQAQQAPITGIDSLQPVHIYYIERNKRFLNNYIINKPL